MSRVWVVYVPATAPDTTLPLVARHGLKLHEDRAGEICSRYTLRRAAIVAHTVIGASAKWGLLLSKSRLKPGNGGSSFEAWCARNRDKRCAIGSCRNAADDAAGRYCLSHAIGTTRRKPAEGGGRRSGMEAW